MTTSDQPPPLPPDLEQGAGPPSSGPVQLAWPPAVAHGTGPGGAIRGPVQEPRGRQIGPSPSIHPSGQVQPRASPPSRPARPSPAAKSTNGRELRWAFGLPGLLPVRCRPLLGSIGQVWTPGLAARPGGQADSFAPRHDEYVLPFFHCTSPFTSTLLPPVVPFPLPRDREPFVSMALLPLLP